MDFIGLRTVIETKPGCSDLFRMVEFPWNVPFNVFLSPRVASLSKPDMARVRSTSWVPPAWHGHPLPTWNLWGRTSLPNHYFGWDQDTKIWPNHRTNVSWSSLELHGNMFCTLWRFVEVWSFVVNHLPNTWNLRYNHHIRFSSNCWMLDIYHSNVLQ